MKIYIVIGSTGEYSDRYEWPVIAYLNKIKAQDHVLKASKRSDEIFETWKHDIIIPDGINEFDPSFRMDYTETSYYLWEVELSELDFIKKCNDQGKMINPEKANKQIIDYYRDDGWLTVDDEWAIHKAGPAISHMPCVAGIDKYGYEALAAEVCQRCGKKTPDVIIFMKNLFKL